MPNSKARGRAGTAGRPKYRKLFEKHETEKKVAFNIQHSTRNLIQDNVFFCDLPNPLFVFCNCLDWIISNGLFSIEKLQLMNDCIFVLFSIMIIFYCKKTKNFIK